MTDEKPDEELEALGAMMDVVTGLAPISEMGKGYKATLVADGWSAEVAERVAGEMMCTLLRSVNPK